MQKFPIPLEIYWPGFEQVFLPGLTAAAFFITVVFSVKVTSAICAAITLDSDSAHVNFIVNDPTTTEERYLFGI